jgi:hypothetical protein
MSQRGKHFIPDAIDRKMPKSYPKRKGSIPGKRKSSGKRLVEPDNTVTLTESKIVHRAEAQLKRGESKPWRVVKDALPR